MGPPAPSAADLAARVLAAPTPIAVLEVSGIGLTGDNTPARRRKAYLQLSVKIHPDKLQVCTPSCAVHAAVSMGVDRTLFHLDQTGENTTLPLLHRNSLEQAMHSSVS